MATQGKVLQSTIDPWAVNLRINTADGRYALGAMLAPEPDAGMIDHRTGVMASGEIDSPSSGPTFRGLHVTADGKAHKVTVEAGHCVIHTKNEGPYFCALDSTRTLEIAPADSAKPRIDVIIARVYDDGNSTIASGAGQRKFTVEAWTGDAKDNPQDWKPPINGGYHILATVHVPAAATVIKPDNARDARGPGLSARGGIRVLPDQLAAPTSAEFAKPGAFPGEQRWMMNPATFPHQVYYMKSGPAGRPKGWQGVTNAISYVAKQKCGTHWYQGKGRTDTVTWLDVPYPGVPYMIEASARCQVYVSANCKLEAWINYTGMAAGDFLNWNMQDTRNKGPDGPEGDSEMGFQLAPMMDGPFDKAIRVSMGMKVWDDYGNAYRGWHPSPNPESHLLFVKVTPAAYGTLRWDTKPT